MHPGAETPVGVEAFYFYVFYFRALEQRRSAQKQPDQEQREQMDKMRNNDNGVGEQET